MSALELPILDNIERLAGVPSVDDLFGRLLPAHRPFVIEGLYRGQAVEELQSLARCRSRLGAMSVEVRPPYDAAELEPEGARRQMSFAEFLDAPAEPRLVLTEYPSPDDFRALWRLPPYVERQATGTEPASCLFAARAGEQAILHFDLDCCCVLLTQVFGRKRVIVIDPRQSQKLQPYGRTSVSLGGLDIASFPSRVKEEFLRYTCGWETILAPGDTIYIPPLYWHHVEYLDTGLSFNVRFWANRLMFSLARLLIVGPSLPPLVRLLLQGIGPSLVDESSVPLATRQALDGVFELAAALRDRGAPATGELIASIVRLHDATCEGRYATPWTQDDVTLRAGLEVASPGEVLDGDRVRMAPGMRLLRPVDVVYPVTLVHQDRLVAEFAPDDEEWTSVLPGLRRLLQDDGVSWTVLEVADATNSDPSALREALTVLRALGCLELVTESSS